MVNVFQTLNFFLKRCHLPLNFSVLATCSKANQTLQGILLFLWMYPVGPSKTTHIQIGKKEEYTFLKSVVAFQEAVGDTLEELWISYNLIEKLKGLHVMKKLKILYMSNNLVKDWGKSEHSEASH